MATVNPAAEGRPHRLASRSVFGSGPVWRSILFSRGSPNLGCESLGERPGGRSSAAGFSLRYGDSFLRPRRADPIGLRHVRYSGAARFGDPSSSAVVPRTSAANRWGSGQGVGPPQPVSVFGMATASSGRGGPTPSAFPESRFESLGSGKGVGPPRPVSVFDMATASSGRGGPTHRLSRTSAANRWGSGKGVGPPQPVSVFGMATASSGRGGPTPSACVTFGIRERPGLAIHPLQPWFPNLGCESLGQRQGGRSSAAGFGLRYGDSFLRPRRADPIGLRHVAVFGSGPVWRSILFSRGSRTSAANRWGSGKGVGPPQPVSVLDMATASSGRGGPTPSACITFGIRERPGFGDPSSSAVVPRTSAANRWGSGQGVGPPQPVSVFGMATASSGRGGPTPSACVTFGIRERPGLAIRPPQPWFPEPRLRIVGAAARGSVLRSRFRSSVWRRLPPAAEGRPHRLVVIVRYSGAARFGDPSSSAVVPRTSAANRWGSGQGVGPPQPVLVFGMATASSGRGGPTPVIVNINIVV